MEQQDLELRAIQQAYDRVNKYIAEDWELMQETPEYFILRRNETSLTGHIFIFIVLGWWTLGLANLLYYFTNKRTKKVFKQVWSRSIRPAQMNDSDNDGLM